MTTTNDALTKPTFTSIVQPESLPEQLESADDSRLCQMVISGYRALRADAAKTYKAMLDPLNKKRAVINKWKREDLESIDAVVSSASTKLTQYRERVALEQEEAAQAALEKATAVAQQEREEEVDFMLAAADMIGDADVDAAETMKQEASVLKNEPPPLVAVLDDVSTTEEPALVSERLTYSAECVSVLKLATAVANGEIPHDALKPNQSWLNGRARADREEFNVPGCELISKSSYARKGGVG